MNNKFNFICSLAFILAIFALGATPSYASSTDNVSSNRYGNIPGTNQYVMETQVHRADARKMRDKALMLEIVRKPDSVSDLVCLPKLMGNFAGLSNIFADLKFDISDLSFKSLCSMAVGAKSDFGSKLSGVFKVASTGAFGLNLPSLQLCTGAVNIGGMMSFDNGLSGGLGGGTTLEAFGCKLAVNANVNCSVQVSGSAGASISVPSVCIDVKIPAFQCQGIGSFISSVLPQIGNSSAGKILGLQGSGVNGGVGYATTDDQISLAGGGAFDLPKALGLTDIQNGVGAMASAQLGLSLNVNLSADTSSSDGFSSSYGVNFDANAQVKAGSGENFKGAYKDHVDVFKQVQQDLEKMASGAGSDWGLKLNEDQASGSGSGTTSSSSSSSTESGVWKISPSLSAQTGASGVIDLMKLAQAVDPTKTNK